MRVVCILFCSFCDHDMVTCSVVQVKSWSWSWSWQKSLIYITASGRTYQVSCDPLSTLNRHYYCRKLLLLATLHRCHATLAFDGAALPSGELKWLRSLTIHYNFCNTGMKVHVYVLNDATKSNFQLKEALFEDVFFNGAIKWNMNWSALYYS